MAPISWSARCSASVSARALALAALGSWFLAACGAGPYGFSRTYEPLMSERGHFDSAQELPYEDVKRAPYDYKQTEIAWFGVVTGVKEQPDGHTLLKLSYRVHQARHLCSDEYQDSCRLTVSESSPGEFVARVKLHDNEKSGKERVWPGSLMKIYGKPTGDVEEGGEPVIDTIYHRHWPHGYYVTTAQRAAMKR